MKNRKIGKASCNNALENMAEDQIAIFMSARKKKAASSTILIKKDIKN